MKEYDETTYGERIAETYDTLYSDYNPAAIDLLAELAGRGPALELGIGTGRIALPLIEKGIQVQGIDASEAMISKLRRKEHGREIEVLSGSFAEFIIDKRFQLIYVVFNTFFALLTQEEQIQCFQCVGQHLAPGGVFVLEAFVPDLSRFTAQQAVRTAELSEHEVQLEASRHDPVAQTVTTQHVFLSKEGTRLYPVKLRYAWPSELDLMARLAGLSLKQRWGSWSREKFTSESKFHISVFGSQNR